MKKNIFLTFVCSLWPGAGQMYMGYIKRGVSLMTAFMVAIGLSGFLNIMFFTIPLPVIWFYAFFDTWSLRNMDQAQRIASPDDFILPSEMRRHGEVEAFARRYHAVFGVGFILVGIYVLYDNLLMPLLATFINSISYDLTWIWRLANNLPTLVVAMLIILLGMRLIRGDAKHSQDDMIEFKGEE